MLAYVYCIVYTRASRVSITKPINTCPYLDDEHFHLVVVVVVVLLHSRAVSRAGHAGLAINFMAPTPTTTIGKTHARVWRQFVCAKSVYFSLMLATDTHFIEYLLQRYATSATRFVSSDMCARAVVGVATPSNQPTSHQRSRAPPTHNRFFVQQQQHAAVKVRNVPLPKWPK